MRCLLVSFSAATNCSRLILLALLFFSASMDEAEAKEELRPVKSALVRPASPFRI